MDLCSCWSTWEWLLVKGLQEIVKVHRDDITHTVLMLSLLKKKWIDKKEPLLSGWVLRSIYTSDWAWCCPECNMLIYPTLCITCAICCINVLPNTGITKSSYEVLSICDVFTSSPTPTLFSGQLRVLSVRGVDYVLIDVAKIKKAETWSQLNRIRKLKHRNWP